MAAAKEQVEKIWSVAGRLSGKQRTVFLLRFGEDMELLEIAAITGMKEGKTHLFRALKSVRPRLRDVILTDRMLDIQPHCDGMELPLSELADSQLGSVLIAQHLAHMIFVQALRLPLDEGKAVGWHGAGCEPTSG